MEVNITKRIDTPDGRRFWRVIFTPNGRIKPDWVEVDERQEKRPEGAYYLDWTKDGQRRRMAVGSDPTAAYNSLKKKQSELDAIARGLATNSVAKQAPNRGAGEDRNGTLHGAYTGVMNRTSPNPGSAIEYPYEAELKNCGQLLTYDLAFDTNSDKLKGTNWPILETLAGLLKKDSALNILIAGHTDSRGDANANQDLSERRARTVMQTLTEKYGVDPNRLTVKGYGAEQPLASNDSEEGRAVNRRVELVKQ